MRGRQRDGSRAALRMRLAVSIIRARVWPDELPEPPEPPPAVVFPFDPCAAPSLRRSFEPPEPPKPPKPQKRASERGSRRPPARGRSRSPPHIRPPPPSGAAELPLPKLLEDITTDYDDADKHTRTLLSLFAQHELAMEIAMANAEKRGPPRAAKPPSCAPKTASGRASGTDRVALEREEMAIRRKFLLRPQSTTYA